MKKRILVLPFVGIFLICVTMARVYSDDMNNGGNVSNGQSYYVLGPDDVIRINVDQHPELSGEFTIEPDGTVSMPNMGIIEVEGLSKQQLEDDIFSRASKYVNNPKVRISILKYASQVIYVLGEVAHPGRYSTEGKKLTLRDALVLAGLPTRFAADGRVRVVSPSRKRPAQQVINAHRILYRGETTRNIELNPGDIVHVPQNVLGMLNDFFNTFLSPFTAANGVVVP